MTNLTDHDFETAEEFEADLARQQDPATRTSHPGQSGPGAIRLLCKVLPIILVGGVLLLSFGPGRTSQTPAEERRTTLSWIAWLCGRDFDPDKNVFTKELEMDFPDAQLDLSNHAFGR